MRALIVPAPMRIAMVAPTRMVFFSIARSMSGARDATLDQHERDTGGHPEQEAADRRGRQPPPRRAQTQSEDDRAECQGDEE